MINIKSKNSIINIVKIVLLLCAISIISISVYAVFRLYKNKQYIENSNVESKISYYGGTIGINFYKETDADANAIVKRFFGLNSEYDSKRNDACWYWQVRSEAGYKNLCKNLELPDEFREIQLDFENHYYVISFGRKLDNVIFYTTEKNATISTDCFYEVYPDYNMNDEYESKAYFYSMDKISFHWMDLEDLATGKYGNTGNEFYAKHLK